ncbi:MAG: 30S ribosome-binding factor RbfA [Halieaceae bacterium]|jgi:ribosome-binding factor A|nr:30S ribosome-binding factor RbfA [Halieaceae bacterium]
MAREYSRTDRVADHLREELAQLIQRQMRDPRVEMVSITDVEVSKDLAHAKVFYTVLGKDSAEEARPVTETLNKAAGFLRSQLSKGSTLRTVPALQFRFDASVGRGRFMEDLIERAVDSDRHSAGDAAETVEGQVKE